MNAFLIRRTVLRTGALVLGSLAALFPAPGVQAAPVPPRAEVKLSCDPGTWRVEYTAGSTRHAPGASVKSRIDISVIDEYGPDKVTGEDPYGLGSASTTGDVYKVADALGAWSTHEILDRDSRPSGHPRSHERTITVALRVEEGQAWATEQARCTLRAG